MATSWDPSKKSSSITLSTTNSSNDTATANTDLNAPNGVKTVDSITANTYIEIEFVSKSGRVYAAVGIGTLAWDPLTDYIGSGTNVNIGWLTTNGNANFNGGALWSVAGPAAPRRIRMAIDPTNKLWWASKENSAGVYGNWNNSGTANPATGTGGNSYSSMTAACYVACCCPGLVSTVPDKWILHSASTDWSGTAPSGFGEINASTGRTASAAMTTGAATMSGAGALLIQATVADTTGAATMAGAGALKIQATAAMNTDAAVMNATGGATAISASAAMTTGAAVMAGAGALKIQATAAMAPGAAVMSASGIHVDHTATAAMVTGAAVMAASATMGPAPGPTKLRYQLPDFKETDTAKLVRHLRNAMTGSSLANDTFTLTPSATSTVVNAGWLRGDDVIMLMPTTASAKTAMVAGYYITTAKGTFTITHASNAATDQTFRWFSAGG